MIPVLDNSFMMMLSCQADGRGGGKCVLLTAKSDEEREEEEEERQAQQAHTQTPL